MFVSSCLHWCQSYGFRLACSLSLYTSNSALELHYSAMWVWNIFPIRKSNNIRQNSFPIIPSVRMCLGSWARHLDKIVPGISSKQLVLVIPQCFLQCSEAAALIDFNCSQHFTCSSGFLSVNCLLQKFFWISTYLPEHVSQGLTAFPTHRTKPLSCRSYYLVSCYLHTRATDWEKNTFTFHFL